MLAKIDRPFLDRSHDRGKVVVGQDHVGGFFGDIGAGDAHGHADVGSLERRGIVDAVAGHRDHLPVGLERLDDAQLVLGADTRIDRVLAHRLQQLVIVHRLQLGPAHCRGTRLDDAQLGRNGRRGDAGGRR